MLQQVGGWKRDNNLYPFHRKGHTFLNFIAKHLPQQTARTWEGRKNCVNFSAACLHVVTASGSPVVASEASFPITRHVWRIAALLHPRTLLSTRFPGKEVRRRTTLADGQFSSLCVRVVVCGCVFFFAHCSLWVKIWKPFPRNVPAVIARSGAQNARGIIPNAHSIRFAFHAFVAAGAHSFLFAGLSHLNNGKLE